MVPCSSVLSIFKSVLHLYMWWGGPIGLAATAVHLIELRERGGGVAELCCVVE